MRFFAISTLLIVCAGLGACANLGTVHRTNILPGGGLAIHLDAQQRLVLVRAQKYCAEPSPDALASYAASLGLGLGKPGKDAASVVNAVQSSVASIGLRTQSITLMRDALYRVCEAIANGVVGKVGAVTLLARSQDLTAVVLAMEQLTGTVAANQVILTSEARANTSATLMANQELLEAAETEVNQKQDNLLKAQEDKVKIENTVLEKQGAVVDAQKALNGEKGGKEALDVRSKELETAKRKYKEEHSKLDDAKRTVKFRKTLLEEAEKNRDAIRDVREAALTQVTATGTGQFSRFPIQRNEHDAEMTVGIATAVKEMVEKVLDKDYTLESCTALITDMELSNSKNNISINININNNKDNNTNSEDYERVLKACTELVTASVESKTRSLQVSSFNEPDEAGEKIIDQLRTSGAREKFNKLLTENFGVSASLTTVLYGGTKFAPLREALANEIGDKEGNGDTPKAAAPESAKNESKDEEPIKSGNNEQPSN